MRRPLRYFALGIAPLLLMVLAPAQAMASAHRVPAGHPAHRTAVKVARASNEDMLVTLYGFPDNSPPGRDIAFPQIHSEAGGTGTFDDPETFATDQNEFAPGTIVYYPLLQKYFIMEDDCAECDQDFEGSGKLHIDLWAGGDERSGQPELDCEDNLTRDPGTVVIDPPSDEPVDTTPVWDEDTQTCQTPNG